MDYNPIPKPPKGLPKRSRIVRTNRSDGKTVEICRSEYAWQQRREEAHDRAGGHCERCGKPAPLHEIVEDSTGAVEYPAGHAAHIDDRGLGGGNRNDALSNLRWSCSKCHLGEHRPAKVVPRKARQA